jgi:hypothetical protein
MLYSSLASGMNLVVNILGSAANPGGSVRGARFGKWRTSIATGDVGESLPHPETILLDAVTLHCLIRYGSQRCFRKLSSSTPRTVSVLRGQLDIKTDQMFWTLRKFKGKSRLRGTGQIEARDCFSLLCLTRTSAEHGADRDCDWSPAR